MKSLPATVDKGRVCNYTFPTYAGECTVICKNCGYDNPKDARFCAKCGTALVIPAAEFPAAPIEPGVISSYSHAWQQLWKHFPELLLIAVIQLAIGYIPSAFSWATRGIINWAGTVLFSFLSPVYSILLASPIGYGVSFAFLKAARGEPVEVKDMFEVFRNYWNAVLAGLLVGLIVFAGFICLIVPGIILACKLAFTPYLVVDRKMGTIEAIQESWRLTGGHSWQVFLIGLLAIPIFIAGLICLGVGAIVSMMWASLATASLYYAVSSSDRASQQGVTAAQGIRK